MKNLSLYKLLFAILFISGCKKDFLVRNPLDSYTNDVLWHSSNDALTALNGCYSTWGKGNNGYFGTFSDCTTDNAFDQFPWENWLAVSAGIATPTNPGYVKWNYSWI